MGSLPSARLNEVRSPKERRPWLTQSTDDGVTRLNEVRSPKERRPSSAPHSGGRRTPPQRSPLPEGAETRRRGPRAPRKASGASTKSAPRRSGDTQLIPVVEVVDAASTKSAPRRSGDLGYVFPFWRITGVPQRSPLPEGAETTRHRLVNPHDRIGLNEVRSPKERRHPCPNDRGRLRSLNEVRSPKERRPEPPST